MGTGAITLAFNYPARGGRPAVKESLEIPIVTSVERTVNVNLTEMPTLIYGYRNNFCMDLGATEKVTFKCERNNPMNYSDSSSDPAKWSNGKWYRHLEDLFDRWQNFGLNASGEQTGGCTLSFDPEDETLLAPMKGNAFLVGALSPDYSVQKLTFSLPMQFATMKPGSSGSAERVTLTLVNELDDGSTLRTTVTVLKGYPQTVPLPDGWAETHENDEFLGWRAGSETIPAGGTYTFMTDTTLTAVWNSAVYAYFFATTNQLTVPSNVNYAKITLVGGGGGGGGSGAYRQATLLPFYWFMGGGGGSGDVTEIGMEVSPGDILAVECGEGGTGGTNYLDGYSSTTSPTNGGGGGATYLRRNGSQEAYANGGQGGRAASPRNQTHGAGGSTYAAGGTHTASRDSGGDGTYLSPNIADNAGKGAADHTVTSSDNVPTYMRGGCGGGAAAFYASPKAMNGRVVASKGGNGWIPASETDATDGENGGGGGSGRIANSRRAGVGGSGCALILLFRKAAL